MIPHRILIEPSTFEIVPSIKTENPYMDLTHPLDKSKVFQSFRELVDAIKPSLTVCKIPDTAKVPDIVFLASAGLSLPRLPEPVVILPWMKYAHRRAELPYMRAIFQTLGVRVVEFPGDMSAPFEGQPDAKWFHEGKTLLCGYGYRSTRKTFHILETLLNDIYTHYGVEPPVVHCFQKQHFDFYHLDIGMLEFNQRSCIIQSHLFSKEDKARLRHVLGAKNVHIFRSADLFALNAVDCGPYIICHKLNRDDATYLRSRTYKKLIQIDMSEFQKSGGSVRCLVFDIWLPRPIMPLTPHDTK
jgi:N-dimethylarginine dimethylaminohydrolase